MSIKQRLGMEKLHTLITDVFGLSRLAAWYASVLIVVAVFVSLYWFFHLAPPRSITISGGPEGSALQRNAEKYQKILARNGVTLKILPSQGSLENLKRLGDPKVAVDLGIVQGGLAEGANLDQLVSLGTINVSPLLVFYRDPAPIELLSQLRGKRIILAPVGSGAHVLALKLLAANGSEPGSTTTLLNEEDEEAAKALLAGKADAAFLMAESASSQTIRALLRTPDIRLYNFTQADAYSRRMVYLSKLEMPRGGIDFGKDIPNADVSLIGPTFELIARDGLHPALIDLVLEAAREVHGKAGIYRRQGEYPAPLEREYRLSPDALRFYTSGKGFLYRYLPFWMASLSNRLLVVFLPMLLVLIPALKSIPALYRWRVLLIIHRWYRQLLAIEREMIAAAPAERADLLKNLDQIESEVNKMKVPASFADQFYVLRGHIGFVRESLGAAQLGRVMVAQHE